MRIATILLVCTSFFAACESTQKMVSNDSWMFGDFVRSDDHNPIMEPDVKLDFKCPMRQKKLQWAEKNVFNPAAIVRDDRVWLLFRAQDVSGTSRIGLADSRDGFDFQKREEPVLYPDRDAMTQFEWDGGCEDPRIVRRPDGLYIMTYTAYDQHTARLCVASSKDLKRWKSTAW